MAFSNLQNCATLTSSILEHVGNPPQTLTPAGRNPPLPRSFTPGDPNLLSLSRLSFGCGGGREGHGSRVCRMLQLMGRRGGIAVGCCLPVLPTLSEAALGPAHESDLGSLRAVLPQLLKAVVPAAFRCLAL